MGRASQDKLEAVAAQDELLARAAKTKLPSKQLDRHAKAFEAEKAKEEVRRRIRAQHRHARLPQPEPQPATLQVAGLLHRPRACVPACRPAPCARLAASVRALLLRRSPRSLSPSVPPALDSAGGGRRQALQDPAVKFEREKKALEFRLAELQGEKAEAEQAAVDLRILMLQVRS